MAVDSYVKLQSAVADAANRDDLFDDVTAYSPAVIDGMVKRAIENATYTISRDLAARGGSGLQEILDDTLTTTAGTETVSLPATMAGIKFFSVQSNPVQILQPKDFTTLINDEPTTTGNKPTAFSTVANTTAYLRPIPDSTYSLRLIYWKKLAALTTTTTNPLFDSHPDIYLAAASVELGALLQDDAYMSKWRVVYDQKMNDLTAQDKMLGWAAAISGAMPAVQVVIA